MPPRVNRMGDLIPAAFQTSSLANSTAVAINSTVRNAGACVLDVSVETNNVRYRADATAPTLTTGVLLQKDDTYRFYGYNGTSLFRFQRQTGTAKISIMAYRYKGDPTP